MTGPTLVERAQSLLDRVESYERRRRDATEVFAVRQAHDDFAEHLLPLRVAHEQARRLLDRGERVVLPDGALVAESVRTLLRRVEAAPEAVRERADADRAVRQHVRAVEAEVEAATRAYVDRARGGLDLGLIEALLQVGLRDAAERLRPALVTLARASQQPPASDQDFADVDAAASEIASVTEGLEDPTHARLLGFLQKLISSGARRRSTIWTTNF